MRVLPYSWNKMCFQFYAHTAKSDGISKDSSQTFTFTHYHFIKTAALNWGHFTKTRNTSFFQAEWWYEGCDVVMVSLVPWVWWAASRWCGGCWWSLLLLRLAEVEGDSNWGTAAACSRLVGIWAPLKEEVMAAAVMEAGGRCDWGLGESAGEHRYSYSPGVCGWPLGGGLCGPGGLVWLRRCLVRCSRREKVLVQVGHW